MTSKGPWAKFLRSREESEAADLLEQLKGEPEACSAIGACNAGELVSLAGTVRYVTILPKDKAPSFEIELYDGSGATKIIWMGRRTIPGIVAGRRMTITGRMTNIDGSKTIYNPRYQLKPSQ
ncbi:MAG: DNA-binding protein [Actinomycetota bacterium]|nr:DNA-binding protein [Actinomycetota bacterium]MDP2288763.1 DNA-binding protein [Actinomycetota bacterium]